EIVLMYSGDGEDRPTLEPVIFEIEIDTAVFPFASLKTVELYNYAGGDSNLAVENLLLSA
ncbi:unnamed protein product, partial [Didymodactylos carnosus]